MDGSVGLKWPSQSATMQHLTSTKSFGAKALVSEAGAALPGEAPRVAPLPLKVLDTETSVEETKNTHTSIQDRQAHTGDAPQSNASVRGDALSELGADEVAQNTQHLLAQLKARDREVRAHEQAHAIVGGVHAGAPQYEYAQGPDGKQYAVSGEVPIDTQAVRGDPEATKAKAEEVRAAALAPAEPSSQDLQVAAAAAQLALQAELALSQETSERQASSDPEALQADAALSTGTIPGDRVTEEALAEEKTEAGESETEVTRVSEVETSVLDRYLAIYQNVAQLSVNLVQSEAASEQPVYNPNDFVDLIA